VSGLPALAVQVIYLAYCGLIVAASVAWYRWAERPLHRWFKRGLGVRAPA